MNDKHLNLFFSYNRDNQLVENNLTRAFIVTLQFLGNGTRDRLLQELLVSRITRLGFTISGFQNVTFALQDNIEIAQAIKKFQAKFVLAIASYRFEITDKEEMNTYEGSKPDAWIYDEKQGLCILIESKVGSNPLSRIQMASHANNWLDIPSSQLDKHFLSISWHEICDLVFTFTQELSGINQQEHHILEHFLEYLGFFCYTPFHGISMNNIGNRPNINLFEQPYTEIGFFSLKGLQDTPSFRLF